MEVLIVVAIVAVLAVWGLVVLLSAPNREKLRIYEVLKSQVLESELAKNELEVPDTLIVEVALLSQLIGKMVSNTDVSTSDEAMAFAGFRARISNLSHVKLSFIDAHISLGENQRATLKEIATAFWLHSLETAKSEASPKHPWINLHMENLMGVLESLGYYVFANGHKMEEKEKAFVEVARVFQWSKKDLQQTIENWKNR